MTDEQIRQVNQAIGKEAFERLEKLPLTTFCAFVGSLGHNLSLHTDGFLGFTEIREEGDDIWSNEGFEK